MNVDRLEFVKASQDTSTCDTPEDVSASALHQGHEALALDDLNGAVNGSVVLNGRTGSHHHTPPDGVNGVGHQPGGDGHAPAQQEGQEERSVLAQEDGFERVIEAEVHASVDEDTDAGDGESSVQALDTVGLHGLGVDVDEAVELAFATLAFSVISQPGMKILNKLILSTREIIGNY